MTSRMNILLSVTYRICFALSMFIVLLFSTGPLFWAAITSLKTMPEAYYWPPTVLPKVITLEAYYNIWKYKNFSRMFLNSLIVSGFATILSASLASLAAYGFSRFRFPGSRFVLFLFLFTQMIPPILLLLPYFILISKLKLVNSYPALIFAYTSFSLPFCTWMLKSFFDSIPKELDEAAMIDGCTLLGALFRVVFPLALPGVAATILFSFLVAWNHYLFAMGLTTTSSMFTLPVGIAALSGEFRVAWNELMAGVIIASVPAIAIFIFLQKWFVRGLTVGAIKG